MSNKRFSTISFLLTGLLSIGSAFGDSSWTVTSTGSTASLRAIVAVNDQNVWASGSKGTVLHSIDGGGHWTKMTGLPEDLDFRGLQTLDGNTVILMSAGLGEKSRLYRTIDAGVHWTLVYQNTAPQAFFDDVAFFDFRFGLVVGDPVDGAFFLLSTFDAGATWKRLDGPSAELDEGAFAASNTSLTVDRSGHAWFGTGGIRGGRIYRSEDYGRTWIVTQSAIRHDTAESGVFSIAFRDSKNGYAIGGDYKKPGDEESVFAETNDGGHSWHTLSGPFGYRSAVAVHEHYVFVTGPSGSEFRLAMKAKKWQPIAGEGFNALSVPARGKMVWACGDKGRIAHFQYR